MLLLSQIFWVSVLNFFYSANITTFLSLMCFVQLFVIIYLIKAVLDLKVGLK